MPPVKVDLPVPGELFYRGDPFKQTFRFKTGDTPEDLTDTTFQAQIRKNADSSDVIASFDVDVENILGEVTISMTAVATTILSPGTFSWDLQGSDDLTRIYGKLVITGDVTRLTNAIKDTSILTTIKQMLGLDPAYEVFDTSIIANINTVLMTLNQLGVGPTECFTIIDTSATWEDFLGAVTNLEAVKSYMYLGTKLLFDPPATSFVLASYEKQMAMYEWRLNVQAEGATNVGTATS